MICGITDKHFLTGFGLAVVFIMFFPSLCKTKICSVSDEKESEESFAQKKKKKVKNPKMVIVVRKDIKTPKAQLATRSVFACIEACKEGKKVHPSCVNQWLKYGAKKIALKINGEDNLKDIKKKADEVDLVNYMVGNDSSPDSTPIILAIGPDSSDAIDAITGHLKLL